MTTIRRSVEQTITRLALRQLRERARLAGTPQARTDASQALALLLDYAPAAADSSAYQAALDQHLGCVMVAHDHVSACLEYLWGSPVRVGVWSTSPTQVYEALKDGVGEIELDARAVLDSSLQWNPELARLCTTCHSAGAILKLDLTTLDVPTEVLCRLCTQADSLDIDMLVIPAETLDVVRPSGHRFTGFKIKQINSLEQCRTCLSHGAVRLESALAPELVAEAQTQ